MRRQSNPHHVLRSRPEQFDLFAQPGDGGQPWVPDWRTLPVETQQALTNLMVRLILEHGRVDRRPGQAEERSHD
jgi:hypothetical protein